MAIKDILRIADWSTDSPFKQFYYHPFENSYAANVLSVVSKGFLLVFVPNEDLDA